MTDEKTEVSTEETNGRREFLKKGAYAAPAILTLAAVPAFANNGSRKVGDKKIRRKKKKKKKKNGRKRKSGKSGKSGKNG